MSKSIVLIAAVLMLWPVRELSAAPPPSGGTIAVTFAGVAQEHNLPARVFMDAAVEALAARGFTILEDPHHTAYVAELILSRENVGTARAAAPTGGAAVQPGAFVGAGAGVIVPLSTGKSGLVAVYRTRLGLQIRKRGDPSVTWQGTAVTVRSSGVKEGVDMRVAADLAEAVLRSYPAEAAEVVGVP